MFQSLFTGEDTSSEGNKMMVYFQRHLKPLEHQRTGIFFKSLARVAAASFDAKYVEKRTGLFDERIAAANNTALFDDCELIPYERFWKLILKISNKKLMRTG